MRLLSTDPILNEAINKTFKQLRGRIKDTHNGGAIRSQRRGGSEDPESAYDYWFDYRSVDLYYDVIV